MVACKKKTIKQAKQPVDRKAATERDPDRFYRQHPAWNFSSCDKELWSLNAAEARLLFWDEILPRFQGLESQTWSDILVKARKYNHSIYVTSLNKAATDRLIALKIEAESIISLRVTATHRVYGIMQDSVFNILWIDLDHGDNETCVCRSHKKHT